MSPSTHSDEPDTFDPFLNAPRPEDYEPCTVPCLVPDCPCQYQTREAD